MTTYKESGVDIALGDSASKIAFSYAQTTFSTREKMIGKSSGQEGDFAGLLDFGYFFIAQCCDTVGTKIDLAEKMNNFSGLGSDLLAMVADDAICLGAETVSLTNTFETKKVEIPKIDAMMRSLARACQKQKIIISGGEIAEVGEKISGTSWGADAIGIVKKEKVINTKNIQSTDIVIALKENGFRCNGFSLIRKILADNFQDNFHSWQKFAELALTPSIVFSKAILDLHGRFDEYPKVNLKGIAHITGGGIANNLRRILKKNNLGARLENLFPPPFVMQEIQKIGKVQDQEAYKTWNMGNGMLIITSQAEAEKAIKILKENGITAQIAGNITSNNKILIKSQGIFETGKILEQGA